MSDEQDAEIGKTMREMTEWITSDEGQQAMSTQFQMLDFAKLLADGVDYAIQELADRGFTREQACAIVAGVFGWRP